MALTLAYANGVQMQCSTGYPAKFKGFCVPQAESRFYKEDFGTVTVQEVNTASYSLRYINIDHRSSIRLLFRCERSGLGCILPMNGHLLKYVKGTSEINIYPGEFAAMLSKGCSEIIEVSDKGIVEYAHITFPYERLGDLLPDKYYHELYTQVYPGIPTLITEPYRFASPGMLSVLQRLISNGASAFADSSCDTEISGQFFIEMMKCINDAGWLSVKFRKEEIRLFENARILIAADINQHYTIPALCRKLATNEAQLKEVFMKIMRKGPFEYLMYLRCLRARDELLRTDKPIKAIYKDAGFSWPGTFITGFRKYLNCAPGELKRQKWNTDDVN